ncbi:MoaD/ThiS family protein, partial [Streptomyces sp. NPDC006356]
LHRQRPGPPGQREPHQPPLAEGPADAGADGAGDRDGLRPGELVRVLQRCSFLVDGDPVGTREHETVRLADGGTVEVLPPFAGG